MGVLPHWEEWMGAVWGEKQEGGRRVGGRTVDEMENKILKNKLKNSVNFKNMSAEL